MKIIRLLLLVSAIEIVILGKNSELNKWHLDKTFHPSLEEGEVISIQNTIDNSLAVTTKNETTFTVEIFTGENYEKSKQKISFKSLIQFPIIIDDSDNDIVLNDGKRISTESINNNGLETIKLKEQKISNLMLSDDLLTYLYA